MFLPGHFIARSDNGQERLFEQGVQNQIIGHQILRYPSNQQVDATLAQLLELQQCGLRQNHMQSHAWIC